MHSLMQFVGIGPVGSSRIGLASLARSETQYLEDFLRVILEWKESGNIFPLPFHFIPLLLVLDRVEERRRKDISAS
jgi:hypothetical protein